MTKQARPNKREATTQKGRGRGLEDLPFSCQRVQKALTRQGVASRIVVLAKECRTSAQAAEAVGCRLGQIAKSLVLKTTETAQPVLVIASGVNQVDKKKIADLVGEKVEMADPIFVKEKTGFAIGGVAPVGLLETARVFIDEDLLGYPEVWAAGGHPKTVFKISPQELVRTTGGRVMRVR